VGELQANCYILSPQGRDAVIIDPGDEAEKILEVVQKNKLSVRYIIGTHSHYDHISALSEVAKATGASCYIHPEDALPDFASLPQVESANDQILNLAGLEIKIIHTPGHTRGSVSILVGEHLFTGDLLFKGSVGRTDLPGGSFDLLIKSLQEKVLPLPDRTQILPGHGPATTLAEEKKYNPFLGGGHGI